MTVAGMGMFGSGCRDCACSRGGLPAQALAQQPDQRHRQQDLFRTDGAYSTVRRGAVDLGVLCCLLLCLVVRRCKSIAFSLLSHFLVKGLGSSGLLDTFFHTKQEVREKTEGEDKGRRMGRGEMWCITAVWVSVCFGAML